MIVDYNYRAILSDCTISQGYLMRRDGMFEKDKYYFYAWSVYDPSKNNFPDIICLWRIHFKKIIK